ncbi:MULTISPECIES: hypothetical protein [unclassified Carboxylicivirga]|uniref:hypothetical protein n=1 Tax=Carboxylicivirga TaxID=1628153 RepID=UPI003D328B04
MKKMNWLSALMLGSMIAFTACSDDEAKGDVFSDLTPEAHKQEIEREGVALVKKMEAAKSLETFDVIDGFFTLMDRTTAQPPVALAMPLTELQNLSEGNKTMVSAPAALVAQYRISDEFKSQTGIYEWDEEATDWRLLAASDTEATFRFTVKEQAAEISVYNFSTKDATHQDEYAETVTELPLSLNAHVKLGEAVLTSFSLVAEWNEDDTPRNIVETITLEDFSFTGELVNTNTVVSAGTAFKYNSDVIYANGFQLDGNFSYDEIFNTIPQEGGDMNSVFAQEVLARANAWFQLGNIKIEGIFDVKGFMDGFVDKAGSLTENSTEEDFNNMMVELINEYALFYVRFADSNEIIAKGEFYLKEVNDYYGGTHVEPAFLMVFGDGSKVSVDDFVKEGFGDLITELEAFTKAMDAAYGGDTTPVQ